ncbi:hypothetical protein DFH29DRAFT_88541 [Suillus ampliporus]|nr:hypothetical protein DFH29DRAFT_88541 [Suillus ampliporus]
MQESNANAIAPSWAARAHLCLSAALLALTQCHSHHHTDIPKSNNQPGLVASESGRGVPVETGYSITTGSDRKNMSPLPASIAGESTKVASVENHSLPTKANGNIPPRNGGQTPNPQEYQTAKKRLKKAVIEYYRYVPFAFARFRELCGSVLRDRH